MADRRAELERKKALVAQMRQEKLRKDDEEKKKKQVCHVLLRLLNMIPRFNLDYLRIP